MRTSIILVCLLLLLPSPFIDAAPPDVALKVLSPLVGFAPLYFKARVTVERNEMNRQLCLVGSLGGGIDPYVRCYDLQGAQEPRTHWFEYKRGLEAGRYEFTAAVRQPSGWKYSEHIPVQSMGLGEGIDDTQ